MRPLCLLLRQIATPALPCCVRQALWVSSFWGGTRLYTLMESLCNFACGYLPLRCLLVRLSQYCRHLKVFLGCQYYELMSCTPLCTSKREKNQHSKVQGNQAREVKTRVSSGWNPIPESNPILRDLTKGSFLLQQNRHAKLHKVRKIEGPNH